MLDEGEAQITTQQQSINQNQRDYDALAISLEETRAQAEQLTGDQYKLQQQLTTQQAAYERLQADEQRLNADKAALTEEQQELEHEQKPWIASSRKFKRILEALTPN